MKRFFVVLLVLAILPLVSFAQAKGGDIYGTIVSKENTAIQGVLLTLTGESTGNKYSVTSDKGFFRFLNIPSGTYQLRVEQDEYKTVIVNSIEVNTGKSSELKVVLEKGNEAENETISARVNAVDSRKIQKGGVITRMMLESIPTARNTWTVLSLIPGMLVDKVDVGGAESGKQSTFTAHGSDPSDTTWYVDDAKITNPYNLTTAPSYLDIPSYTELQVTTTNTDIKSQTGGVQLNFITPRAMNRKGGELHLYTSDKAWEMKGKLNDYMKTNNLVVPGIDRLYQYGLNFGGPIFKEHLWWFGAYSLQDTHKRTETNTDDTTTMYSSIFKTNFQAGTLYGNLGFLYNNRRKWGVSQLSPSQQDLDSLWDISNPTHTIYVGVSQDFNNLQVNLKGVINKSKYDSNPRGSTWSDSNGHEEGTEYKIINGGERIEGSNTHVFSKHKSSNISLDTNYYLENMLGGDHEIKFGVDFFKSNTSSQSLTPNQRISYIYRDGSHSNYLGIYPDYLVDVDLKRISLYLQDAFRLGKMTISLGFRYDKETSGINSALNPYFTWYEPTSTDYSYKRMFDTTILDVNPGDIQMPFSWKLLSPRLALTYDIAGNGKNVIKLTAGRYMTQSSNRMAANYIPKRYGFAEWTDTNGDEIPQYGEVGALFYSDQFTKYDTTTDLKKLGFTSDYNTPYLDELTLSFENELMQDLSVSLTGFYKKRHNLAYDINANGEYTAISKGYLSDDSVETSSNWKLFKTINVGGTLIPVYTQIETPSKTLYYNYKKSYYRYTGIQFVLDKKFSNRWMANLSVTLQNNKRHIDSSDIVEKNNYDYFNDGQVSVVSTGSGIDDIWMNSRWLVKFSGMYQLPWGISATTFFQAREGYIQPLRTRLLLPQGVRYFYIGGIKSGDKSERLPAFYQLNLGLEKTIKISDAMSATLVLDWYNVTNRQTETKRSLSIEEAINNKGKSTMWMNPGILQFGVRVKF